MATQTLADLDGDSTLDQVDAVLGRALEELTRLEDGGRMEEANKLFETVVRPLQALRRRVIERDLQNVAVELNGLSEILENAERALARDADSLFLRNLPRNRGRIDAARNRMTDALRNSSAEEAPSELGVEPEPAIAAGDQIPPVTGAAYAQAFKKMTIRETWLVRADRVAEGVIQPSHADRYRAVERKTLVPWWFIGLLHSMEASFNFKRHLHNGDPLSSRTVNVPADRPPVWGPGMPWEESAVDALVEVRRLDEVKDWSLGNVLEMMERWNGLGYRRLGLYSPFLWAGSTYYRKGKFVADHQFDAEAVSAQVGVALVLKRLQERGALSVTRSANVIKPSAPAMIGSIELADIDTKPFKHADAELKFPKSIKVGMGGSGDTAANRMAVRRVQEWSCHHGFRTGVDGDFGDSSGTAIQRFQTSRNLSATGIVDEATWHLLNRPMREALAPVEENRDLASTVIGVARQHISRRPIEIGGNNHGPWVRLYMAGKHGEDQLWCAGFACFIVAQAARDLGISMPFKRRVGVDALVADAKKSGRFIPEANLGAPRLRPTQVLPGTLFVVRSASDPNDWTHVGIVTRANLDTFDTIEGNTNGSNRDGANAKMSNRSYKNKDFIRLV